METLQDGLDCSVQRPGHPQKCCCLPPLGFLALEGPPAAAGGGRVEAPRLVPRPLPLPLAEPPLEGAVA